jgi:hypothetical protein
MGFLRLEACLPGCRNGAIGPPNKIATGNYFPFRKFHGTMKPKIDQRIKVIFKSYEHDYTRIIRRTNAKSIWDICVWDIARAEFDQNILKPAEALNIASLA